MAEVVSIILALPPLMISCLEQYRKCLDAYSTWKKFAVEYRRCQTDVQIVNLEIDLLINRLLLPVVDSAAELERLKNDEEAMKVSLRKRLQGQTHAIFPDALRELHESLKRLKKALELQDQDIKELLPSENPSKRSRLKYERFRCTFSLSRKPRQEAFADVRERLKSVHRILNSNDQLAELERHAQARLHMVRSPENTQVQRYDDCWQHNRNLHDILADTWSCECSIWHCADLKLKSQPSAAIEINMEFVYSEAEEENHRINAWTHVQACVSCATMSSPIQEDRQRSEAKIRDMCMTLGQSSANPFTGLLESDTTSYNITLARTSPAQRTPDAGVVRLRDRSQSRPREVDSISLQELLEGSLMNRKQRYGLAIVLASSHMQLYDSGWLPGGWHNDGILMRRTDTEADIQTLFLRFRFLDSALASDSGFMTLGILLLELCFGELLDQCQHIDPTVGQHSRIEIARKWLRDVEGDTGEQYAHAVDWCLNYRVADDVRWREAFIVNVLEMLQRTLAAQWPDSRAVD